MDSVDLVNFIVALAGVVFSGIAVRVSLEARRDARQAPVKAAQREIRAQVREHAETLLARLSEARSAVQNGADLGGVPESLEQARVGLGLLAPRLNALGATVTSVWISVQAVELHWGTAAHEEGSLKTAEQRVEQATAHARKVAEYGAEAVEDAEADVARSRAEVTRYERARADRRTSVRESVETATTALKDLVNRLNAADMRG